MYNSRPGEDLVSHLLLTGELAGHYGKEFENEITARTLGLLHDTGKATDKFQRVLNKDLTLVDHAVLEKGKSSGKRKEQFVNVPYKIEKMQAAVGLAEKAVKN